MVLKVGKDESGRQHAEDGSRCLNRLMRLSESVFCQRDECYTYREPSMSDSAAGKKSINLLRPNNCQRIGDACANAGANCLVGVSVLALLNETA